MSSSRSATWRSKASPSASSPISSAAADLHSKSRREPMQNLYSRACLGMLAALGWCAVGLEPLAAQGTTGSTVTQRSDGASLEPVYQPPMRGAPSGRVGGGTRGAAGGMPTLDVLAPDHVGLTL